nr:hypothetical protein [Tanacetum cinerariifolium]
MAPLTFVDPHNMVVFLSKSDASDGFDQIVDFLNAHTIKYALMVNPTICVVVTKAIIRRDLHLDDADGVECLPNVEIFEELTRMGYEKPPLKLTFYKAFFSPSMAYAIICLATGRKFNFLKYIFDNMVRNVDSPSVEVPITHAQPCTTSSPSPTELQDTTPTPHDTPPQYQPPIPHDSPLQDQPTTPYDSPMSLLTTLMETCANLLQNVVELEKDRNSQALEILQLKKRVKRLERKKVKDFRVKKAKKAIDADKGTTLVNEETDEEEFALDANKGVSAVIALELVSTAEPIVFDNEDVIMTMDQTLIKLKEEKARILDEKIAQKLHDEEVQKVIARDEQEKADIEKALELQRQLDKREDNIDCSVVAKQNMASYKMQFFKGMTYNEIRPIFESEYNKIQTLFKQYKDVQKKKKKRVADETLLQESFKKLQAAEVSRFESTQEIPINDPKEITDEDSPLKIRRALSVELKRLFEPDANDVSWKLQRYMHATLRWILYSDCRVHYVSSTRWHDIYTLIEKDYPLSNVVMILMLSGKLQVEEDIEMARDLVLKIVIEANRSRNKSV